MDIIKLTRELGAAIQQDDRYAKFQAAQKANEEDKDLNDLMGKIQLVHMSYQHEASKEDANEQKLAAYETEFNDLYKKVMENEHMRDYEVARAEIDEISPASSLFASRAKIPQPASLKKSTITAAETAPVARAADYCISCSAGNSRGAESFLFCGTAAERTVSEWQSFLR